VVFISGILSIPDNMRAGKTIAALTALLAIWYALRERHRFHGPAWAGAPGSAAEAAQAPAMQTIRRDSQ
jgi:hypothetical protein